MIIQIADLKRANACEEQIDLFYQSFGDLNHLVDHTICVQRLLRFHYHQWFAERFLTVAAITEYEKVRGPALTELKKVCGWCVISASSEELLASCLDSAKAQYNKVCWQKILDLLKETEPASEKLPFPSTSIPFS